MTRPRARSPWTAPMCGPSRSRACATPSLMSGRMPCCSTTRSGPTSGSVARMRPHTMWSGRRRRRRRRISLLNCRPATRPGSDQAVKDFREGSGSGLRWPERCCVIRACCCWTRRRARSTRKTKGRCRTRLPTFVAGRTTVVVAHRLSTVRDADLVVVLAEGRAMEQGTHAGLLEADGLYARLVRSQALRQ